MGSDLYVGQRVSLAPNVSAPTSAPTAIGHERDMEMALYHVGDLDVAAFLLSSTGVRKVLDDRIGLANASLHSS